MPLFVLLLLVVKFGLACGFFYLLSRLLDIGVPVDALWGGLHRTWLGAAATMATLVVYMFLRLGNAEPDTGRWVTAGALWLCRAGVWTYVSADVYRVTRWRKGKLVVLVLAGLALDAAMDFGLDRLQAARGDMVPSFGSWTFRLC